jgi:putative colanic acid biosynthesis UDP-glucose lipid carrier transferase
MNTVPRGVLQSHPSIATVINVVVDLAILPLSLLLVLVGNGESWATEHTTLVVLAAGFFQLVASLSRVYTSWRGTEVKQEVSRLLGIWVAVCGVISLFDYYLGVFSAISPHLIGKLFVVGSVTFTVSRVVTRWGLSYVRQRGYNHRSAAIVGAGRLGLHFANQIQKAPWLGVDIIGFYDDDEVGERHFAGQTLRVLGDTHRLVDDARLGKIDRIYITLPMNQDKQIHRLVSELADTTCSVIFVPDVFTFNLLHSRAQTINGVPVISIFDTPMEGINQLVKRLEDIILGSLILLFASPVLLGISLAVKLTSSGPIFFKQKRYGIDGKAIDVWKFRSMTVMEDGDHVCQAQKHDSRFTPIGGFLRRTSLDELPQFLNVLQGSMSIVGPRPHAVAHNEQYRKIIHGYMLRHKVKPGITGWAQINGWRGETDTLHKMEKRIEYDLDYIRGWSLALDLKIVFLTIFKGFINKNAY